MSQCVPSWDIDDNPTPPRLFLRSHSNSTAPDVPMLDYEVAELTWENGQLAMHGLGQPRVPAKPVASAAVSKYPWEKPRAGGTLESIVNQATRLPHHKPPPEGANDDLVPWLDHQRAVAAAAAAASVAMTMDALVPCSNNNNTTNNNNPSHVMDSVPAGLGPCGGGSSTRVGSCSGGATKDDDTILPGKRERVARVPSTHDWSSRDQSVTGSGTFDLDSQQVTLDTCDLGSPENTSSGKPCTKTITVDDHDSVCHSRPQRRAGDEEDKKRGTGKSSVSSKRRRAAAIHNQSERKRRDKINQRMKTLQKLVPNSSKTDKASMLDEVIEYLKQLQAQVQMMNRMNMSPMMMPMTLQQQLQMSLMAQMGMGMGMSPMGMGVVDMNSIARPNVATTGISPLLHPTPFLPLTSWDVSGDRLPAAPTMVPDPLAAFLACQSQPMTMDAYSRMAALYQHLHQHPASSARSQGL